MKRRLETDIVTYFEVTEFVPVGQEPYWMTEHPCEIVLEEDLPGWLETVKGNCDVMPEFCKKKSQLNGVEFDKIYTFGNPVECDDFLNIVIDEDCGCGHLIIDNEGEGKRCSECDFTDEKYKRVEAIKEVTSLDPPLPEYREPGLDLEGFVKKWGFESYNLERQCTECKQETSVSDFFITKEYACIIFGKGHKEDCANKDCPACFVTIGE